MDTRGESADFSEGGNSPGSHLQPNVCYENVVAVEGNHRGSQLQPKNPIVIPLELLGASPKFLLGPNSIAIVHPLRFWSCSPKEKSSQSKRLDGEPNRSLWVRSALHQKNPKKRGKKSPPKRLRMAPGAIRPGADLSRLSGGAFPHPRLPGKEAIVPT